jgi:hypothetical protein
VVVVNDHRAVLPNFDNPSCIWDHIAKPVHRFIAGRIFDYAKGLSSVTL